MPIWFLLKLQDSINIKIFFFILYPKFIGATIFLDSYTSLCAPYNLQSSQMSRPIHCPVKDFERIQLILTLKMKIKVIDFDKFLDSDRCVCGLHCGFCLEI